MIDRLYISLEVNDAGVLDGLTAVMIAIKKVRHRFLSQLYAEISGAERDGELGQLLLAEMRDLFLEIKRFEYKPIWHLTIYNNGHRCYQSILPSLDGVIWQEKTIDSPTIKVNYSRYEDGDTFISLFQLLSFEDYQLYKNGQEITVKKI